ncbi:hypothetical protein [Pseudanabaena sp. UWO310]|uniref:hypothetical protein n=1 Tax=Pseudanabaena sp. UWO310 TaxID=2480795 RepID=UPI00115725BC|nr:hypothetical protein [Pseudanabaena sp. UWO310]TYQ29984.1 hypothetical protein PseudUWO310_11225 [Pseudanabaena sp. UWO310]
MSELTKIAAILFKNLSDALLATASEISKLDWREAPPETLSQADEKPALQPSQTAQLVTHYQYDPKQKVLVQFEGSTTPTKCRILKRVDRYTYLVYGQRSPRSTAIEINADQILGLDPDR